MKKLLQPKHLPSLILFALSYVMLFILFFLTLRYSRLNYSLYFLGFAFIVLVMALLAIAMYEGIIDRNQKLKVLGFTGLAIVFLILSLGVYMLMRINTSINNVIVDNNQQSTLELAFVTYDNSNITSLKDINGKTLGILSNSEDNDRNSYVKSEIESNSININYVEYLSYNDMILGLFSDEIDVASLPSDYVSQFEDNEGYAEYLDKTTIIHDFSVTLTSTSETVDVDVTKEPFTVLIMGNDGGRTDSLILATYNPLKLSVTMTSVPRDSYVPIACYPNQQKDKIGHAFAVSRDCAIDTVEDLLEIDVNYYVEVNFQGVVEIVDALDRVWLNSPVEFVGQDSSEERGHYTVWIPKGGFWATGEMALTFARERHQMPGGDYQRQENQQQVIQAIVDRTLSLNDVNKALAVLEAAGNNIKTNMPLDQMISIFNSLMKAINKTNIEAAYMLDIQGSRVMGYSSYTYNDPMQLPLWIIVPYKGSIEDVKALMMSNLENPEGLPTSITPKFFATQVFWEEDYFIKTYSEKEVHEKLPDFMPNMTNNNWTLANVLTWASTRNIKIAVEKVEVGNPLYNANVPHNTIVGQSVRYGIKTSSFTNLTVKVIKHVLDCSLDENADYDECRYRLPNFVFEQTKLSKIVTWAKENNIILKYITIPETDPTYDISKIGYALKQDPETWEDIRTLGTLTLTVMDANYSIVMPDTKDWTETIALAWVKDNLMEETNYLITYVATTDLTKVGKVISTTPATNAKIKYNEILKLEIYAEGFVLGNQVGKLKTDITDLCTKIICTYSIVETSDDTKVGQIATQSLPADTLKTFETWLETTVDFGIYTKKDAGTPGA